MALDAAEEFSSRNTSLATPSASGFFGRFVSLAGPYWTSDVKWRVRWLTLALVVLTVGQVVIPVALNAWSESLFDALEQKSMGRLLVIIGMLAIIIVANAAVTTTHMAVKRQLQVGWRKWLTHEVMRDWMRGGRHYQISHTAGEHDNPDGRIAEDIRITTEYAIDLAHSMLFCGLLLVSFTKILWSLSGPPQIRIDGIELYLPGHLVWVALVYAAVGTSVAVLLGQPLVHAVNRRQTGEANFRFGLVHARENAEAIALLHGESDERRRLFSLFRGLQQAWNRQTGALIHITLFTSSYSVLSTAFPILIAAPRYIAGAITLGVLMQTAQAFQQMQGALSWPIDNMARVAEWRASVERVLGLTHALEQLDVEVSPAERQSILVVPGRRSVLSFQNVSVANPDGAEVIGSFDADIKYGERVLISGDPGAAVKLFKVVGGLWPWGRGRVGLPHGATIFFMPQRPYLPIGPLREALTYPTDSEQFDDADLRAALTRVGLEQLSEQLNDSAIWEQVLAVGEQQRLGFARILLQRPNWIFIQEATDALDPDGEDAMMRLLDDEFSAATIITVGYHSGLDIHHRRKLTLAPSGKGQVRVVDQSLITSDA